MPVGVGLPSRPGLVGMGRTAEDASGGEETPAAPAGRASRSHAPKIGLLPQGWAENYSPLAASVSAAQPTPDGPTLRKTGAIHLWRHDLHKRKC